MTAYYFYPYCHECGHEKEVTREKSMLDAYCITLEKSIPCEREDRMTIAFGTPAQNDAIVQSAAAQLLALRQEGKFGGALLRITGPASLPVAITISHIVAHLYGAIAVFDPKVGKYLICITHDPRYKLGDWIEE
jgi:CRISPR-associated protein Csx3